MKSSVAGRSWKGGLFFPFLLTVAFAAVIVAALIVHVLSAPLVRTLTAMERRPMRTVSGEIFLIASDTFQHLVSYGKEKDPAEEEIARRNVLAQIRHYRAEEVPDYYHFAVLDEGNRILVESSPLLDGSDIPPLSGARGESEFSFRDREGKTLLAHHRYFPAWRWHILTIVRKEDLAGETVRIRNLLFVAGGAGLLVVLSLTYLLFRTRIRKPLSTLARFARGWAGARYGPVPGAGGEETRELIESFHRMMESIRQRHEKLEAMAEFAESNPNLIMMVTRAGMILYANQSVERMLHKLGLPPQHYELLLPDDAEEIANGVLSGEGDNRGGACILMGRTFDYTAFALAREDAVVFYGVDMTEKIAAEEQLLRSRKLETIA